MERILSSMCTSHPGVPHAALLGLCTSDVNSNHSVLRNTTERFKPCHFKKKKKKPGLNNKNAESAALVPWSWRGSH